MVNISVTIFFTLIYQVMPQKALSSTTALILEKIRKEYAFLSRTTTFSLQELFNHGSFRLDEYCKEFTPHPQSDELRKTAKSFGEQYGVWLDNAKHHITCALFLYPAATPERMLNMMKNLTIDFYLNDVMGRDVFHRLSPEKQKEGKQIIQRMSKYDPQLRMPTAAPDMEKANIAVLRDFKRTAPEEWFTKFHRLYNYHIAITHRDNNAAAMGRIQSVEEYTDLRCHLAGMHHIVLWVEYGNGLFLDWNWLRNIGIDHELERLHWVTAAFGALSNDLFSFEKEVIQNGGDSNLLMVIALNEPDLSLFQVIYQAAGIVRELLVEYVQLLETVRTRCASLATDYPERTAIMEIHLAGLERGVQASWMWQVYTQRYKCPESIWEETLLTAPEKVRTA